MKKYLQETDIINYSDKTVSFLAAKLAAGCDSDKAIARNCFVFVRDAIRHSGDSRDDITTVKASEVLAYRTGWCYAKAILLAALLRANHIPAAFCYQRLSCSEYKEGIYCLHGLNAIYLKAYGWYKVDARGNKEGVNAQFNPPVETLAFVPQENEYNIDELYADPIPEVLDALKQNRSYHKMVQNFPDFKEER